jgi:phosphopantothenoylcysteine decarboxylase/phosphopantothenate--cysteine ligase
MNLPRPVVVTAGPASAPIDAVRRITNFSTGELGARISDALARAGFRVVCLMGEGALFLPKSRAVDLRRFTANRDLDRLLLDLRAERPAAILHAAALADYEVASAAAGGQALRERKISSAHAELTLTLRPAPKLIARLRRRFPDTRIVGWKYELDGGRASAVAKAERQIAENRLDASVVNGTAYGPGFGWILPGQPPRHLAAKADLARFLARWLRDTANF